MAALGLPAAGQEATPTPPPPPPPTATPTDAAPTPAAPTPATPTPTPAVPPAPGTTTPTPPPPPPPTGTTPLLPDPGTLPDPALGGGGTMLVKPPLTDAKNDEAFERAVTGSTAKRSAVAGPVITLDEALRITLQAQPNIKLAQEDLEIARAGLQQAISPFNSHVYFDVKHGQSYTPFPDGQIKAQREAKKTLIKLYKGVRSFRRGGGSGKIEVGVPDQTTGEIKKTKIVDLTALGPDFLDRIDPNLVSQDQINQLIRLEQQAALLDQQVNTPATNSFASGLGDELKGIQKQQAHALALLERQLEQGIHRFNVATTSRSTSTNYEVGVRKVFRNGISFNPHLDWNKGGIDNNAKIAFDFIVPLGQGRGGVSLRAAEQAAYIDMQASELQLRHGIADALLQTSIAYWNCVAAQQTLGLLMQSEEIASTFVDLSNKRLENKDVGPSEVSKARARQADAIAQTVTAEFALLDARRQLAIAIGLDGERLENPPFAAGDLPEPSTARLGQMSAAEVAERALGARDDRKAAYQLVRSGKMLADAAFFDIKPRFDFFFNFGAASIDTGSHFENYFSAFTDRKVGIGAEGGFNFDWPVRNDAAKANYYRSLAQYGKDKINAQELDRQIRNDVMLDVAKLRLSEREIDAYQDSARYSGEVIRAVRQDWNSGRSSLLDTIQVQEQFTTAQQNVIAAKLRNISTVSTLRFDTGTLLEPMSGQTPETVSFNSSALKTLPNFDGISLAQPLASVADDIRKRPEPLLK